MASLRAEIDCKWSHVKIHGSIHHQIGVSKLEDGRQSMYSQLFFMESEIALEERLGNQANDGCQRNLMIILQNWLNSENPFAKKYIAMYKRFKGSKIPHLLRLVFLNSAAENPKTSEQPNSDQVAAVYVDNEGESPDLQDVQVETDGGGVNYISPLSDRIEPLVYPLIIFNGEHSWSLDCKKRIGTTMLQYCAYRLVIRPGFSLFHR